MHSVSTKCFSIFTKKKYRVKKFCFWDQSTENYVKMVTLRLHAYYMHVKGQSAWM